MSMHPILPSAPGHHGLKFDIATHLDIPEDFTFPLFVQFSGDVYKYFGHYRRLGKPRMMDWEEFTRFVPQDVQYIWADSLCNDKRGCLDDYWAEGFLSLGIIKDMEDASQMTSDDILKKMQFQVTKVHNYLSICSDLHTVESRQNLE
jgi:hypothetical protein